jgi:hypothetical protein
MQATSGTPLGCTLGLESQKGSAGSSGSIRCSVGVCGGVEVSAESSWASIVLAGTRSVSVGHDAGIAPKLVRVLASRWECL